MKTMLLLIVFSLLALSALLTVMLALRLLKSIRQFQPADEYDLSGDPSSVSVCIPARNEVHAMTKCLERVLASDYKKIEVLVFDDSSTDNTSIIIRSFAQAGVRFVAGSGVPEGWLGKNYALDVLAREASGTYVIFLNVDTAITKSTISRLVAHMKKESATMLSVIPERADGWRLSVLFGYLRYFWELTVWNQKHPATASALWMIDRHVLQKELGGMAPLKTTAAPESALALLLGPKRYRCLISNEVLEVTYEKKWLSQLEASRRLLYPKTGGTPTGAALAIIILLLLNMPLGVLVGSIFLGWSVVQIPALAALLLGMATYGLYAKHLWRETWWVGPFLWPIVVLQELVFLLASIIGYWRHTITWKGRPVLPAPVRSEPLS